MSDDNFAPDHLEGVEYIMRKQNNDLLGGIIAQQQTRIEELEAKLAQQDDLVQAAVAAALREAVAAVKKDADNDDISHGAAQWVSDTILALITPDAQAALDRAVAAERERCAKIAQHCADFADTNGDYLLICNVVAAIRKRGE